MPFKRYVEIGRVALVNYGKDYGKLVVIVDFIDQNRIDIPRIPNKKSLIDAPEAADAMNKWESSYWGRKLIVQTRRASLDDFDKFKRGGDVREELVKLKEEIASSDF